MVTINDFVEDWIAMRSTLQRQLKMLESGEMRTGGAISDDTTKGIIVRVKQWIEQLNTLLKEHANAPKV